MSQLKENQAGRKHPFLELNLSSDWITPTYSKNIIFPSQFTDSTTTLVHKYPHRHKRLKLYQAYAYPVIHVTSLIKLSTTHAHGDVRCMAKNYENGKEKLMRQPKINTTTNKMESTPNT